MIYGTGNETTMKGAATGDLFLYSHSHSILIYDILFYEDFAVPPNQSVQA